MYKSLDILVKKMIETYGTKASESLGKRGIKEFLPGETSVQDLDLNLIILGIAKNLATMIEPWIKNGLDITADDPPSEYINITSGSGIAGGKFQTLNQVSKVRVPLDGQSTVQFLLLKEGGLTFSHAEHDDSLTLGKIIIPKPGRTNKILDDKPDSGFDGYIISGKDMFFDEDQTFDDASINVLKDAFRKIAAETIFGTIKLSENLQIQNTTGSLIMDSTSIKLLYPSSQLAAKFNKDGTYFYSSSGDELAKFSVDGAHIGNIEITSTSIQSKNFVSGSIGFKINDAGDVEFDDAIIRGTIHASAGTIGGFTIGPTKLYGGTIQTSENVESGATGVIIDTLGLRGYDSVLGQTFNLPTDGSAPIFSSGIINNTIFEVQTNAVIRTSETVGDGTSASYGILINNTGFYGCGANQLLQDANLKLLAISGNAVFKGTIISNEGSIGNITINDTGLYGGLIQGVTFIGGSFNTSSTIPRLTLNSLGLQLQVESDASKYSDTTRLYGSTPGTGARYGTGVVAYFGNPNLKTPFYIVAEQLEKPDIHLYNRSVQPTGAGLIGDLVCMNNNLWICDNAGTPGIYTELLKSGGNLYIPTRTSDPVSPVTGQMWFRTDV